MHILDDEKIEEIKVAFREGLSRRKAAKRCGVWVGTVARYYDAWKDEAPGAVSKHAATLSRLALMIEDPKVVHGSSNTWRTQGASLP